jgi:hypothetical protein
MAARTAASTTWAPPAYEDALHRKWPEPLAEPLRRRSAVGHVPGAVLILHAVEEARRSRKSRQACLHTLGQTRRDRLGRHVHAEVDASGRVRPAHLRGPRVDPRTKLPLPARGIDQPRPARLVEGARDRGEVDVKVLGQSALRRQAHARWQPTGTDISQCPEDGEILRARVISDCRDPGFHH